MIEIVYNRRRCRLTAVGHAGSGEAGHDLVCAAVSALVLTLAVNVTELAADRRIRRHVLRLQQGDAWISCVPEPNMEPVVAMLFDAVCTGFDLLQTLYPENIEYRIVG